MEIRDFANVVALTAGEATLRAEAQAERIAERVAADPVHKGMALMEAMEAGWL